ncbi:hypothetical protein [Modestobacter sp. NPDC049651]|uniref:hypothetical protein n=1 Tax=Modestobacter sp. NPDC049651 TaxID=3155777 RepID=UPI0033C5B633
MRQHLQFLWQRPVLGAALVALLQTTVVVLLLGVVRGRPVTEWLSWVAYGVAFFVVDVVSLRRERRRLAAAEASR